MAASPDTPDLPPSHAVVSKVSRWRIAAAFLAALAAGLVLAACGSGTTSPPGAGTSPATTAAASPTPGTTSAVCQATADLRDSIGALTHVAIGKGSVSEINSDLADVQAKFTALTAQLNDTFKSQTSAVKSALDSLRTAVSDLSANPGASTVKNVVTAVAGAATAVGSLLASLAPQCGSTSASASPSP